MQVRTLLARALRPNTVAYAHCDIPCGIYDPKAAQVAAETVEKMMTLIADLQNAGEKAGQASLARYVAVKEQHAEKVKQEVRVIWGDYFKPPHLELFPNLHTDVWNIMKTASACRQGTNIEDAKRLRAQVDEFAAMFAKSKQG